jgi:hypothetical protein
MTWGSITAEPRNAGERWGCPTRGPVTSFLFLRYCVQSFKVGIDILDHME